MAINPFGSLIHARKQQLNWLTKEQLQVFLEFRPDT